MGEPDIRQGVRVKMVRSKCVRDNRRQHIVTIVILLIFLLAMHVLVMSRRGALTGFELMDIAWIAYVLWFVIRRLFHYSFLAADGMYIVTFGYAVRIPWDMIKSAETVVGRGRYAQHRMIVHFEPGLVDEVTGTPILIEEGRDDVFPFDRYTLEYFKQHTTVTVSA